jgi:Tfp pilus assembly protein PilF
MLLTHPSLDAELEEGLPTRHAESGAATIALSYERLNPAQPSDALAQLAPAPIPQRLLVRLAERDPDDEDQVAEVDAPLRRLAALGLVDLLATGAASMHRLVAAFVRDQDADAAAHTTQAAARLISEVYVINQAGYPQAGQPYVVYLQAFAPGEERLEAAQQATLLSNLGYLLYAQGDLAGARPYLERALAIYEQALGPTHRDTATSLNNLGYLLQAQGDLAGARPYYERALDIREQVLGPTHPDTAISLNNLGMLLHAQGDLAEATQYLERALAIREQVLGPTHPDTARSLNDLGSLLQAQGDLVGARPYYERALDIREQALGPTHPDTAISIWWMADLAQRQGDFTSARSYYERALAIFTARLGPNHPHTQAVQRNLAALDESA